jgi:hypothetical protein
MILFDQIKDVSLAQAHSLLVEWFPNGKIVGKEFCVGNIDGDPGESLKVNLVTGKWSDFASDHAGHDLIELLAARNRTDRVSAARALSSILGIVGNGHDTHPAKATAKGNGAGDDWEPMVPLPPGTKRPDDMLRGFDTVHEYTDLTDRVTHYVGRIEARDGRDKQFIPVTYGRLNGGLGWHKKAPIRPLPLYRLNRLTAMPDATVILTEGEKAADAAQAMFPDHACLSWFGGVQRVDHADLTPLKGRNVIVWPDNDDPGKDAAKKLARPLSASVLRVDDLPAKADAADVSVEDPEAWLAERIITPRGTAHGRLTVFALADLETAPRRDYILKGLIAPNEISVWVGAPKCGKSFLLLDVTYRLSLRRLVFKRRVKQVKVLYVAAEGEGGIGNRIKALRDKYGPSDNFHWIAQPADLLHKEGHLAELTAAAGSCGAQLIVLDTLSRMLNGGDENSPADMGKFVANVTELRVQTKAHIAVIHHPAKGGNGGHGRGHSCLEGADDALIEVTKHDDGSRSAHVVHAKDDADGDRFGFNLEPVVLGIDEDGDKITTLVVNEQDEAAARPAAVSLSDNQQIAMRCLNRALATYAFMSVVGQGSERLVCYVADWRKVFDQEGKPGALPNTKRMAFDRAVGGLLSKGLIGAQDDLVWRTE